MKYLIQAPSSIDTNDIRRKVDGGHSQWRIKLSTQKRSDRCSHCPEWQSDTVLGWCNRKQVSLRTNYPCSKRWPPTQRSRGAKSQFTDPQELVEQVFKANYSTIQEVGHSTRWVTCSPHQDSSTRKKVLRMRMSSCAGRKGRKRKNHHMQTVYILKIWLQRKQA